MTTLCASKRLRSDDDSSVEWKLTIDQTGRLRTLMEVVGNVLTRINVRLASSAGSFMLCIDSIDPQHVCMIQARLVCEKTQNLTEGQESSFCVDSSIINHILKNIPTHYSVDLEKHTTNADLHIHAYESLSNSHHVRYELPTLVDDSETMALNDLSYKYTVEIDLGTLRQIVKMSSQLRAQKLTLTVREPNVSDKVQRTAFSISSNGDAKQTHNFYSATLADSAQSQEACVIRAVTDSQTVDIDRLSTMRTMYEDHFSAQYLGLFLKSMERQIITMKVSNDKPLVLYYPLGADRSFICFVLAPKTEDE